MVFATVEEGVVLGNVEGIILNVGGGEVEAEQVMNFSLLDRLQLFFGEVGPVAFEPPAISLTEALEGISNDTSRSATNSGESGFL